VNVNDVAQLGELVTAEQCSELGVLFPGTLGCQELRAEVEPELFELRIDGFDLADLGAQHEVAVVDDFVHGFSAF
jgi:hypothetical protein